MGHSHSKIFEFTNYRLFGIEFEKNYMKIENERNGISLNSCGEMKEYKWYLLTNSWVEKRVASRVKDSHHRGIPPVIYS